MAKPPPPAPKNKSNKMTFNFGDDDEDDESREIPVLPKFDSEGLGKQYDDQYPRFVIPPPIVMDADTDWRLD